MLHPQKAFIIESTCKSSLRPRRIKVLQLMHPPMPQAGEPMIEATVLLVVQLCSMPCYAVHDDHDQTYSKNISCFDH